MIENHGEEELEVASIELFEELGWPHINAFTETFPDSMLGRQTTAMSFIVQRPADEPGFRLERIAGSDRRQSYALHPYAADRPAGARYGAANGGGGR